MNIEITTRCNMKCAHCARSCTEKGIDMSLDTFTAAMNFCKQLRDLCGCKQGYSSHKTLWILLSGGEPTVHPRFWDFVNIALETIGETKEVVVTTNGKRTEDALKLAEMAEKKQLGAGLSLDRYHEKISPKVVDAFRRQPKGYKVVHTDNAVVPVGRALKNGLGLDYEHVHCGCPELVITALGEIYACDCRDVYFGNAHLWRIPYSYLGALSYYGHYCTKGFLHISKATAEKDPAKSLWFQNIVQAVMAGA